MKTIYSDFNSFITKFIGILFKQNEWVSIGKIDPNGQWSEIKNLPQDAAAFLISNSNTPNLFFGGSVFAQGGGRKKSDCVRARAVIVDIDANEGGHKKSQPFDSVDDIVGFLLTMPMKPSIAWFTGHGVQCAFLLNTPCEFGGAEGDANLKKYENVGASLKALMMADAVSGVERMFRVPLTINDKSYSDQALSPVKGALLWCEEIRCYTLEKIQQMCDEYDIPYAIAEDEEPSENEETHASETEGIHFDYKDLPQYLRTEIEGSGERSERLFGIVIRMLKMGADEASIQAAVRNGHDFVRKYGERNGGLNGQVKTIIAKINQGNYVYHGVESPIRVYNFPSAINLNECSTLSAKMERMLNRYWKVVHSEASARIPPRVLNAATFHEHLFKSRSSGIMQTPCGSGKSVWAICHIAVHASTQKRYVYVVETVETLHKSANILAELTVEPVGRMHGFNAEHCKSLCGKTYNWQQCRHKSKNFVCRTCPKNAQCPHFTRDEQKQKNILVMTHARFVRSMEEGSRILKDARVIIDEGLSPFSSCSFDEDHLLKLMDLLNVPPTDIQKMFPHTWIAALNSLNRSGVAGTFASRCYLYCNAEQIDVMSKVAKDILRRWFARRGISRSSFNASAPLIGAHTNGDDGGGDEDSPLAETVYGLINFFRQGESGFTCAYHETVIKGKREIECKRSRFNFAAESENAWHCLWMLDASASLSVYEYPDNMPAFSCPDLVDKSNLITLHVLRSQGTKAQQDRIVRLGSLPMFFENIRHHKRILVCVDKDSSHLDEILAQIRSRYTYELVPGDKQDPVVTVLTRGRIRGVNNAGECTLVLAHAMSTFTGLTDCALYACLRYCKSFPDTPYVFTRDGFPNWKFGRMRLPAMRNYYALRSLDELYQTIYRSAVRNDQSVEAMVAVPHESWLVTLYRTVMPGFQLGSAWKEVAGDWIDPSEGVIKSGTTGEAEPNQTEADDNSKGALLGSEDRVHWERDDVMLKAGVIGQFSPGDIIEKQKLAKRLGYNDYSQNSKAIKSLLDRTFEETDKVRELRRAQPG